MADDRQICILRTSCDTLNKLSINSNNSLIHEEIKDGQVVSENDIACNIKTYAAVIDSEDKIHIIYTDDNITLKYTMLPKGNDVINIISAKQGLMLQCINIKILVTTPHIFFALTDPQHDKHSIYHSSINHGNWKCKEIFIAMGHKHIQPYFLEVHNMEIYILLYLSHKEGRLALYRLENSNGIWKNVGMEIYLEGIINISFFISPKNIAIIAYNKLINRNFQTIIIYKNLRAKSYEKWKMMILSEQDTNTLKPSIFFNKEEYYMTWEQGTNIVLQSSKDLIYWREMLTFDKYTKDYLKCFYMSNNLKDSDLKINSMYLSDNINSYAQIHLYFRTGERKKCLPADNIETNVDNIESNADSAQANIDNKQPNINNRQSNTDNSEEKLKLSDKKLEKNIYENNLMKSEINYLNGIIRQYEEHTTILNKILASSAEHTNIYENNFLNKMMLIKKDNDALYLSFNDKLLRLLKLIKEKDQLINDLYKNIRK